MLIPAPLTLIHKGQHNQNTVFVSVVISVNCQLKRRLELDKTGIAEDLKSSEAKSFHISTH